MCVLNERASYLLPLSWLLDVYYFCGCSGCTELQYLNVSGCFTIDTQEATWLIEAPWTKLETLCIGEGD